MNSTSLSKQQRVVVTAGASSIGLAIAQKFLSEGAKVFVCDIDAKAIEAAVATNVNLDGCVADVGIPSQVETFFKQAFEYLGGIDVLVNNAGIGGPTAKVEDIDYDEWDACLRINLSGMFYCVKQVIPQMKAQNSGCIVNISTGSTITGLPKRLPYVASKVGVQGLTHNLARELGPHNIRCNTVLPGMIDNPRGRMLLKNYADENAISLDAAEQEFKKYISMQTWIQPSEIADAIFFLCSDAARHITAQELAVDGNSEWEE